MDALASRLDDVKKAADEDISSLEALQDGVQRDKAATEDLLNKGKAAQQVLKDCGNPAKHLNSTHPTLLCF